MLKPVTLAQDRLPVAGAEDITAESDGVADQLLIGAIWQRRDELRTHQPTSEVDSELAIFALGMLVH